MKCVGLKDQQSTQPSNKEKGPDRVYQANQRSDQRLSLSVCIVSEVKKERLPSTFVLRLFTRDGI